MTEWKKVNIIKFINFFKINSKDSIPKINKNIDLFLGITDLIIDDNLFSIDYIIDKDNSNIKIIKQNKFLKGVDVLSIPQMAPGLIQTFSYAFQINFSSQLQGGFYISSIEDILYGTILCEIFNGKYCNPPKVLDSNILGFLNFGFSIQLFDEKLNMIKDSNTVFSVYINNSLAGKFKGGSGNTLSQNAPPLLFGYEDKILKIKVIVENNPLVKKFGFRMGHTAPQGAIFLNNTTNEIPFNLITFNKE